MSSVVSTERQKQFSVLGVAVDLLDNYVDALVQRVSDREGTHVVTLNSEMTMQAKRDPKLADIIDQAELVIPDGAGIVLYLKLYGRSIRRCPGIELSAALLEKIAEMSNTSVFFYGGAPGIVDKAAKKWTDRCPNLDIVGAINGFVKGEEMDKLKRMLQETQPNVVFVGLGVPRQEYWIAENRHLCPQSVWIGVGGSFDIWSETKQRAPKWLCDNNLEWTYRLYQEPFRWRRMLDLPKFAGLSLLERFSLLNFSR